MPQDIGDEKLTYFVAPNKIKRDPLSSFLESCNISLKLFGFQRPEEKHTAGPRIYGDTEIIYVIDGESVLTINGTVYHGFSGDMFVIPKYTMCQIDTNPDNPHTNYFIHMELCDFTMSQKLTRLLGGYLIHPGIDKLLLNYYQWMDANFYIKGNGSYLIAKSYLHLILLRVLELVGAHASDEFLNAPSPTDKPSIELLRRAISIVEEHHGNITVNELCNLLYISTAYLRRFFTELLHLSPSAFIQSVRMREAEIFLTTTTMSVIEISARLGFSSPYHFTTVFTKKHDMPPTQYRRLYSQ